MYNLEIICSNELNIKAYHSKCSFINFKKDIDLSQTDNFLNFISFESPSYLDINSLICNVNLESSFIDLCKIEIKTSQYYKLLILFLSSIYKKVRIDTNYKYNFNNDLYPFLNDLYIYFNNCELNLENLEVLYNSNDILIYKIDSSYFLFNFSVEPKKILLPESLRNKTFYSIFCNNDKHLKENFIFGKNAFFLFEEIQNN